MNNIFKQDTVNATVFKLQLIYSTAGLGTNTYLYLHLYLNTSKNLYLYLYLQFLKSVFVLDHCI